MTIEPKAIEQEFHYQVDQQVSVNSFIDIEVEGETVRFQVTSRYGSTPEKIIKTARANIEAYTLLRQEFPRNFLPPPPPVVVRQAIDGNGNPEPEIKSFIVERLSVEMRDGKFHYKVLGKPFTQYGVTAWPEVLIAAALGVNPDGSPAWGNPPTPPNIAGWTAEYIEKLNDKGKMVPAKVTRLLKSKSPF